MSGPACPGFPIEIVRGTDWNFQITYMDEETDLPVNLTGYTAKMEIRATPDDTEVIATLTTENGGITIDGVNGIIDLFIPHAETVELDPNFKGVYDLMLIAENGEIERLLAGSVYVIPEVTKFEP